MARLLAPDDACAEVDMPSGHRYRGRVLDVTDAGHAAALKAAGYTAAGIGSARGAAWRCGGCGFRAFFRSCGRCGGACTREES